jgi:hypothetical protein
MFAGAPDVAPVPGPDRLLELASPAAAASAIVFPDDPAVRWRLRDDVVDSHVPAFLYHRLEREIDVLWSDDAVALLAAACARLSARRHRLAGRTLADLVTGTPSELVAMPWVEHRSRRWEPEPLRYLASRAIVGVLGSADRHEDSTGRTARRARLVSPFLPPG